MFLRPQMTRSSRAAPAFSVHDRLAGRFCVDVAGAGVLCPEALSAVCAVSLTLVGTGQLLL